MAIALNRDKFGQEERQTIAALLAELRPFVQSNRQADHLYKTGKHLAEDLEEFLALAPAKLTVAPLPKIEACRYRWNPYCQNSPAEAASALINRGKTWKERTQKLMARITKRRARECMKQK